jgi:hypothetical protein
MTHLDDGAGTRRSVWLWGLRILLAAGILYSTMATLFYGWYAGFPGPNVGAATVVANIWSVVAVACLGALVASFFRGRHSKHGTAARGSEPQNNKMQQTRHG